MNPIPKTEIDPELLANGQAPPDHTGLPDSDGTFARNFQEHPQSLLLTDSITPVLQALRPEGDFCIGQDSGIYWRWVPDEPLQGVKSPDWFVVLGVPPTLQGQLRRSYVLWYESVAPLLALEFVSGSGLEERDRTPREGKFWVYEQAIRIPYYGIYDVRRPGRELEVHRLVDGRYRLMEPDERGRYEIEPLGVELGLLSGEYAGAHLPWLRFWDREGRLLLTGHETAERERQEKERERQEKEALVRTLEQEQQDRAELQRKLERLAERLRAAGLSED